MFKINSEIFSLYKLIFTYSVGELISKALNFATFIIIARSISVEDFGSINYGIVIVSFFIITLGFFHDDIAAKKVARNSSVTNFNNVFITARFLLSLLLYTVVFILAQSINENDLVKNTLIIYGSTLLANAFYVNWYYRGIEKPQPIAISQIISSLISFLCALLILNNPIDSTIAVWIILIKEITNSLFLLFYYIYTEKSIRIKFELNRAKEIFNESSPLALSAILLIINGAAGQFFLGLLTNTREVGIYSAAYKIIFLTYLPSAIIVQSFFPRLSKQRSHSERTTIFSSLHLLMIVAGSSLTLLGILFSNDIINIVYTIDYLHSIPILQLLFISVLFVYVGKSFGCALVAWDGQKYFMLSISLGALINIILNIILIPKYLSLGAVISALTSEIIIAYSMFLFYKRINKTFT